MKRLLYSAAILASLASCSKNEVDLTSNLAPKAISFSTLNDRVSSRTANDDGDNYNVYAFGADSKSDWFMEEEIIGATDAIESAAVYYWPKDALDFLAVAPADNATNVVITDDFATTSASVAYTNPADGSVDLTAARALGETGPAAVGLQFEHQLAKIIVRVTLNPDEVKAGGSMEGWSINNLVADKYVATATPALLSTQLTVNHSTASYKFSAVGTDALATMTPAATAVPQTLAIQNHSELGKDKDLNIVPQASTGCEIALTNLVVRNANGVIMNNADNATYTIVDGNVATKDLSANYFHPGKVYILDIMLSFDENSANLFNGAISFDSSCDDWYNAETGVVWPDDTTNEDILWE